MSAQIRTSLNREVYRNFHTETVSFYVYDENCDFAGGKYDYAAWRFLGNASIYYPAIKGDMTPVIVSPNTLPSGRTFPQVHVTNLHQANEFYQAYAEVFVEHSAIEAERAEWAAAMANAEAAEVRARELLNPSVTPPF